MPNRVMVVMPTYNEVESLAGVIARLRVAVPTAEVLVVDDDSPDGTGALADRLAGADPLVRVLHRPRKAGLGVAYRAGFAEALASGCDVVVECDADGSHRPEDLPRLLAALEDHDVAVGSRWVAGGATPDWPLARRLLSRGGSAYARQFLGLRVHDVTGGYRAFRASALRAARPDAVEARGYAFQIELIARAADAACEIAEVPITFDDRTHGRSKMSSAIIAEAFLRVTALGIARRLGRRAAPAPAVAAAAMTDATAELEHA
jgi:dolichol-phosphate mannosyltransferase